MTKQGIITEKDAIRSMLIEAQNQLTQAIVTDRLYKRRELRGLDQNSKLKMGANQEAIRQATKMVEDLKEFYKDASEVNPLADLFPTE
jgi:hypothetical protein